MKKIKVLVVDDNPDILDLFNKALNPIDYKVALAQSGDEALHVFESENPDIVMLDIKMPNLDGIETLRRIKYLDEKNQSAVIMLTGYGEIGTAREAMALGAYDYVTKPVDLNFIDALLKEATKQKVRPPCVN